MTAHGLWPPYVHRVRGRLASKVVSIAEGRFVDRADVRPGPVAHDKTKRQEETWTSLVAAAAGLVLGQRGRGAPVAVLRGIAYERSDDGVAAMLHKAP
ncbi:hypothetical protein [Streptomyces sp. NPDC093589]|uniref:hypothetical protein n=1 Tax=Streptomyces sp. NPDC093589 TaxID=3366043 RepID=UPI0037F5F82D